MSTLRKIRILLTGGGTGGHIYPLVAVKEEIAQWAETNRFNIEFRYFGDPSIFYNYLLINNIVISRVASSKFRRYFSLLNIIDFFKFFIGLFQALWKVFRFMPDVAFSKGGPGVLPIVLACAFYRVPLVIHESDSSPGLANSISARFAKHIGLAFPAAQEYFVKYQQKLSTVGQPVRADVLKQSDKQQAKLTFGLDPNKPVVLVLGGSQGAQRINEFVLESLKEFLEEFQFLHQVGNLNYKEYKTQYDFVSRDWSPVVKSRYYFVAFFEENIGDAYDAADLVISRAGAGTIFEIAAKGRPAILIPLPESARRHQELNAYSYAETGAALVIEEENVLVHVVLSAIRNILSNEEKMRQMSSAAKSFYKPESAEWIANDIVRCIK